MEHTYTPNESDAERLKTVREVIELLPTAIKSGTVDGKTREVIESLFFDSMQDCFDKYSVNQPNIENLKKAEFVTLFEAALLIGSFIDHEDPERLLLYSSGLFSDGFLNGQVDPRHPITLAKYSAFQPVPRAGIVIKAVSETATIPNDLGRLVIQEVPELHWKITPKEAAEFAISKGYHESLFSDLIIDQSITQDPETTISNRHQNESNELAILNQASLKFWANADRDDRTTHPKNEVVAAWLLEKGFNSKSRAEAAASIIRPEWAVSGRLPEE